MPAFQSRGITALFLSAMLYTPLFAVSEAQAASASAGAQLVAARGAWSASVTYALDDLVTLRGSTWRSKHAGNKGKLPGSTSPSTAADWEAFAVGFNPAGAWVSTRRYEINEIVARPSGAWRAKNTSLNKPPETNPANWTKFVDRGPTGATGPRGPQGVPGSTAVANGSASAPAFRFTSSPDTGIFSPSAGKIALAANGALFLHDIGPNNLGLGNSALNPATTGFGNVAIGVVAMLGNTTGSRNVAVGRTTLQNNTTGSSNTAVGDLAMQQNSTGSQNTAVGDNALLRSKASNNTAVGFEALQDNTAANNTAVGSGALANNTTGTENTALGQSALANNTTGEENTAVGFGALQLSNANSNTAVGHGALQVNSSGVDNVALGRFALNFNKGGSRNIALGKNSLVGNTAGSDNIAIGHEAGVAPDNSQNSIFIGNGGLDGDTATIKIGKQGTQTSAFIAGISGVNVAGTAVIVNASGQLGTTPSSRRYKEDIQPMGAMSDMLASLRPVSFRYRKPFADGSKPIQYGLVAEEVAETFPYLAVLNEHGQPETVSYHLLPTFLLEGFQEQQRIIAAQSGELQRQRAVNAAQADELQQQQARIASLEERLGVIEAMFAKQGVTTASN